MITQIFTSLKGNYLYRYQYLCIQYLVFGIYQYSSAYLINNGVVQWQLDRILLYFYLYTHVQFANCWVQLFKRFAAEDVLWNSTWFFWKKFATDDARPKACGLFGCWLAAAMDCCCVVWYCCDSPVNWGTRSPSS